MNNKEYKLTTSLWDVKSRGVIEASLDLIKNENTSLIKKLESTLASEPITKPPQHVGGKETDYFRVLLKEDEMQDLIDIIFDLESMAVPQGDGLGFEKEAIQAREANRIASLVDEWNKLNAD